MRNPFEMTEHWDHECKPSRVYARDANWTARERIAVECFKGILANPEFSKRAWDVLADMAFKAADALLAAGGEGAK